MNRIRAGLTLGVCVAVVGMLVVLNASALATRWESLGPNAWGGTTDPADARAWWTLGVALLATGLTVVVLAVARWLRDDPAGDRTLTA